MSGNKSPLSNSSRQLRVYRKPTGEEEWAYAHNPYDDSSRADDVNVHKFLNPCRHYAEGRCNRGSTCRFYHDTRHTVIVASHGTPNQRAITSLTGVPLAAAPAGGGSHIVSPLTACLTSPNRWLCRMPSVATHTSSANTTSTTTVNTPTVSADAPPPHLSDSLMGSCRSFRCAPPPSLTIVGSPFVESTVADDAAMMMTPTLNPGNDMCPTATHGGDVTWSP